jgi:hypothetical protein
MNTKLVQSDVFILRLKEIPIYLKAGRPPLANPLLFIFGKF